MTQPSAVGTAAVKWPRPRGHRSHWSEEDSPPPPAVSGSNGWVPRSKVGAADRKDTWPPATFGSSDRRPRRRTLRGRHAGSVAHLLPLVHVLRLAVSPLRPEQIDLLPTLSAPTLHPEGGRAVVSVVRSDVATNEYVGQLWVVPVAGGEPTRLTRGHRDTSPRFFPDGRLLAFLRAQPGDGQYPVARHAGRGR